MPKRLPPRGRKKNNGVKIRNPKAGVTINISNAIGFDEAREKTEFITLCLEVGSHDNPDVYGKYFSCRRDSKTMSLNSETVVLRFM